MDKFCEDCIHNEVCQYGAIPPHIGRCNDKDTLDDIRPRGEWILVHPLQPDDNGAYMCSECKTGDYYITKNTKFCPWCGADMRGENND